MISIAVIILEIDFKLNWKFRMGVSVTIHLVIRNFLTYDWKRMTSCKGWVLNLLNSEIPASGLTKKTPSSLMHFLKSNMSARIKAHKKEVEKPVSRHPQLKLGWDVCFRLTVVHTLSLPKDRCLQFHIQQHRWEYLLFIHAPYDAYIFLFNPQHNLSRKVFPLSYRWEDWDLS